MQAFNNFEELLELIEQIKDLPADDDRVIYDPLIEKTLEIQFSPQPGRVTIDEDGKERELFDRLLLRNVESFEVEIPDDGRPHRIVDIERIDAQTYRFVLTHARWVIKINGEPNGEFSEVAADTDFEFSFSMTGALIAGVVVVAAVIGLIRWVF